MKVSLKDIAKEVGVSPATVSRVLNNSVNVSAEVKTNVLYAVKRLGYVLPSSSRGTALKSKNIVGIVTINTSAQHYSTTIDKLSAELPQLGYTPILCNTGDDKGKYLSYFDILVSLGCAAIFCIGSVFRETLSDPLFFARYSRTPFILNNCVVDAPNCYSIVIDEKYSLKLLIDHLISTGKKEIAYVRDANSYSGNQKQAAFVEYAQQNGLNNPRELVVAARRGLDGGEDATISLLQKSSNIDAIIYGSDTTAIGGMKYLQRNGFHIPEDIAVAGFNNSMFSRCCSPSLTTVNTKIDHIAYLMADTFRHIIIGQDPSHLLTVTPELIIQQST